jgi:hypothetical protein
MALTKRQEEVNEELACNAFGRLSWTIELLETRNYEAARAELTALANFLPGNRVVTIGDADQALLDLNPEDDQ